MREVLESETGPGTKPLRPIIDLLCRRGIWRVLTGERAGSTIIESLGKRRNWLETAIRRRLLQPDPSAPLRTAFQNRAARSGGVGLMSRVEPDRLPVDELLTLAVAGFETLVELLGWSLRLLSDHPGVLLRLRSGGLTSEQVIKETLRLFPPTWMYLRQAVRDASLPGGFHVPAGTKIYLCQYVTQRDDDYWPHPHKFLPDRSSTDERFAFFPFGGGPRRCPADLLARALASRFLDYVVNHTRYQVIGGERPAPKGRLTLEPACPRYVWWEKARPRETEPRKEFSIVVPTYNRPKQLRKLLASLQALDYPKDRFEVIVVDDGGAHDLNGIVDEFEASLNLKLHRLPGNAGPSSARQEGTRLARFEYLAFTDDDCRPAPDWLARLDEEFGRDPVQGVGGRTVNAIMDNHWSEASQMIIDRVYRYFNPDPNDAGYFATNNVAFPKRLYQETGGLPRGWEVCGGEDRFLCHLWKKSGHTLRYRPDLVMFHYHGLTPWGFFKQHFQYGRGGYRFTTLGGRRVRIGNGFFLSLLRYERSEEPLTKRVSVITRVMMAQVATALGYLAERLKL